MKFLARHAIHALGLLLSIGALVWLGRQFELKELALSMHALAPLVLAPVALLILVSFVLRAQRWRLLVEHQPSIRFWPSFRALMIGYLLNNILPARAGDFARALELGRTEEMSRTKVFATLVTERTVDMAATIIILAIVLLTYPALPVWLKNAGIVVAIIAGTAITLLLLAHIAGRSALPWLTMVLQRCFPPALADKLSTMIASALDGIAGMFRPLRALGYLSLTVLIWVVEVAMVYLTAQSLGLPLPIGNALFVLLVLAIGSMVPSSPGFVGTYEFFGISALALIGINGAPALAFVVLLHAVTLLGSTIIGYICFLMRPRNLRAVSQGSLA